MSEPRVCMFVLNPLTNDTRVEKEAATLAEAGYEVRIVAALRPGLERAERRGAADVERVDEDPLPTKLARAIIGRRRGVRGAEPGSVIPREAAERGGLRGRLTRRVLAVHLRLAWRKYLRAAFRAARARPADVWIAHDLETLPVALRAARRLGGGVVYDSHELFVDSSLARARRPAWARLERRLIARADAVVTVSESIADELARRYGIERPSVVMNAPEGGDGEPLEPVDLAAEARLPAGSSIAIYVGGIQQDRGLEQLVQAAAEGDELAVVLLGPGTASYRAELERLIESAGVSGRVRLLPPVPPREIASWAAGADVGVFAGQARYLSYYYSLPNKLFDYMRAGLPVVVSDFPDMRALVERHDIGRTCDPASPSDLAGAIAAILADRARYAELQANARRAAELYTWEREGRKLVEIVSRLRG